MKNPNNIKVPSQPKSFRGKTCLALAAALLVPAVSALSQSLWVGGTSDFNVPASWQTNGVDAPYIGSSNPNCSNDSGSNNVVLIQPGDPIWQHGDTLAGNAANTSGAYLQTGSTNNTGGGNWLRMALGAGSFGSYVLSNGVVNVGGQAHIGEQGVGYLEIDGGVFNTAADPSFVVGDGDFGVSPVGYVVMNGGTNNMSSEFWIGEGNANNHGTGYFTMNGGTINVNFWWDIGRWGADGYFTMNGGTINKTGGGDCQWGAYNNGVPSSATVNMTGGTININNNLQLGTGGNGTVGGTCLFNQSGGTVHVSGEYWVGNANIAGICTNNISGNAVLICDSWLAVGRNGGVGTMNISGNAAVTVTGVNTSDHGNITLSGDGGGTSSGTINQNGGTVTNTAMQTWIAENYNGYWNLYSGTCVLGVVHLSQNSTASGTFNLNGGDLTATEITDNGGTSYFNFNGGTLHVGSPVANPWIHGVNGAVNMNSTAIIDTAGNNANITQALTDNGAGNGLTKNGDGTLTLSGANTYSGPTVVNAGTLATTTASFANGAYSVADNASLSVAVQALDAQLTATSVTLGTTTGAANNFDLGGFGNPTLAALNITGNLAVNGTIVVNIADSLPQIGQFPLIKYGTKSGSGTFTIGTVPVGVVASIVDNPGNNSIDLNIASVALDIWNGMAGGNWDIDVTTNWANAGTGLPTTYLDGVSVVFNDTAQGSTVVNLVTNVQPRTITILNNVSNYTLVGNGEINGAISLNKQGAAPFAIFNTNGYTGPTVLSGGTLVVTNLANGDVVSPIGASSASPTNLVLNGGMLSYAGAPLTINRGYSLQYNYGINGAATVNTNTGALDLVGDLTLTGPLTAAAGSSFVKSSPGTLTYAGTGTNQLSGGNDPGYQVMAGTVVFDGSAGTQVNSNQQEFFVGDTTNSGANLILTNTTLNVDSWFCVGRGQGPYGYTSTATLYNSTLNCANFSLGYWNNLAGNVCTQIFTLNNSHLISAGAFNLCESAGSTGYLYINGNSVVNENGPFIPGMQSGAACTVVMSGSSILTNNLWASIGANGAGTLVMSNNTFFAENSDFNLGDYGANGTSGTFDIQDNAQVVMIGTGNGVYVGKTAGAIGLVNQLGGTINARSCGVFQFAQQAGSTGTWYQSGGTNYAGGWVSIGRGYTTGDTSPNGLLVVSGGLFDQTSTGNGLIVGEQGTGTLLITNSGLVVSEASNIGVAIGWNGGIGELDLGGGTLIANFIQGGTAGGSSAFNFNGGLLKAGANAQLNFMTNLTSATVLSGAVIDTANNTIAFAQPLLDGGLGGGLNKLGSGTLLLDGVNSYAGATTVTAGTLGGSGTIASPVVVNGGAALSPGDLGVGTLTVSGTLSLAGTSTTVMKLNAAASTSSTVAGISTVTYGGTLVLQNLSGSLALGQTFTLFGAGTYGGSFSGVVSQTPGQTVTWDLTQLSVNGTVKVASVVAAPARLTPVVSGGNLNLSWPAGQIGWQLQEQTNALTTGLGTNWVAVPGSASTNQISLPTSQTAGSVFFRLQF